MSNRNKGNKERKEVAKAYEKYAGQFTPKPKYLMNSIKAFIIGGLICASALKLQNVFIDNNIGEKSAGAYVVIILICGAQLLTGFGLFDSIGKFAGAGVIVPITGFANAVVAPAMEFKSEGHIMGIGARMFTVAGPVIVYGTIASIIAGGFFFLLK